MEGHAAARVAMQIGGADIGLFRFEGKGQYTAGASPLAPDRIGRIVQVEHRHTVRRQAVKNFALGFDDLFRTTEFTDMCVAGIADDGHVRPGQADRIGNFTHMVGAELNHCRDMLRRQLQQGQRHAQVVIQVAPGGQHRAVKAGTQDAGEQLLDGGLAAGAGHRCQRRLERIAIERTQSPQRQAGIGHHQLRQIHLGNPPRDQGRHRALGRHIGKIVMAVEARSDQGDEQLAGLDGAAIGRHRAE